MNFLQSIDWPLMLRCFIIGGLICIVGQILIDKTKITPARILTLFVTLGVILGFLGIYEPIYEFGKCGASVPISGFGYSLYKGTVKAIAEQGFIGIFTGGVSATAGGIAAAIVFGFLASLFAKPTIK